MFHSRRTSPVWRTEGVDPTLNGESIHRAAAVILKGGVVVYPTETFYGLGGRPDLQVVIERVYGIKGREEEKPLPLIACNMRAVRAATAAWPAAAERLAKVFWPGPLTLILPAGLWLPSRLHAGTGTIAVRITSHPTARSLCAEAGGLLISTSANLSGQPACSIAGDLSPELLAMVDGVLDAGELPGGLSSTIVDVNGPEPRLVRPGPVSWENIQEELRPVGLTGSGR